MSFILTGNLVTEQRRPNVSAIVDPDLGVMGAIVTIDARASTDPDNAPLTFDFKFLTVPIGSKVALTGFSVVGDSPAHVSFKPDIVGTYVISVSATNGVYTSAVTRVTSIRSILVPHARGLVPDGKFIWNYLRDVWTQVEDREFFETLWSALIQIAGGELLKLYQVDYGKSIRDIQSEVQKRWLPYEPKLDIVSEDASVYLGNSMAGAGASTGPLGYTCRAIVLPSSGNVKIVQGAARPDLVGKTVEVKYSLEPDNLLATTNTITGLTPKRDGFVIYPGFQVGDSEVASNVAFSFPYSGSGPLAPPATWDIPLLNADDDIRVGDVVIIGTGANAGEYPIVSKTASTITVDRAPPKYSDGAVASIQRPIEFFVAPEDKLLTNTILISLEGNEAIAGVAPGRVIIVNGQTMTIQRVYIDRSQRVPVAIVTVDREAITSQLTDLYWRIPNTLVSKTQNFESLGVSSGDTLVINVGLPNGVGTKLQLQIVGVDRNSVGFVLSDEPIQSGIVPKVPDDHYIQLSTDLGIPTAKYDGTGVLTISGKAYQIIQYIGSQVFKNAYWNKLLPANSTFTIAGTTFILSPVSIIRNRLIPVDSNLKSVPALQEYIVQPKTKEKDGVLYEIRGDKEIPLPRTPVVMEERSHYVLDRSVYFGPNLVFRVGSDIVEADAVDFVDYGITPGDTFEVEDPAHIRGSYTIVKVISQSKIKVARPIQVRDGSGNLASNQFEFGEYIRTKASIKRGRSGHFLRVIPGLFSAKSPIPERLWAEVSFIDNRNTIESNFGLIVGLTSEDLEAANASITYRQAVAGLMYVYTHASSLNNIRTGLQILTGLPFAEHRGIIRNINSEFLKDLVTQEPTTGRILIEDVDDAGEALGIYRFYEYPINVGSRLSGIEVSPVTGAPYVVGDTVEEFAPLCKGIEVTDYLSENLSNPMSGVSLLQKFNTSKIFVGDSASHQLEISLVSSFLRRITPSYMSYYLTMLKGVADDPGVLEDTDLTFKTSDVNPPIVDNISMGLPHALMFDARGTAAIPLAFLDEGSYSLRRSGTGLSISGGVITLAAGGLIDPRNASEVFEPPLCKIGDYLALFAPGYEGRYTIGGVTDTTITVSDGPANGFEDAANLKFAVMRKVGSPQLVLSSSSSFVGDTLTITGGQFLANGVAPGDWVVPPISYSYPPLRRTIIAIQESTPGSGVWDQAIVSPPFGGSASGHCAIYRPSLLDESFFNSGDLTITADGSSHLVYIAGTNSWFIPSLLDFGDELVVQNRGAVLVIDPVNSQPPHEAIWISEILPAGTYPITVRKSSQRGRVQSFDTLDGRNPMEFVGASLIRTSGVVNISSGGVVSFPSASDYPEYAKPGDLFIRTSGPNSTTEVGYGPGAFVVGIADSTNHTLTLTRSVTAETGVPFKLTRRLQ
jgi:hypothetical protein